MPPFPAETRGAFLGLAVRAAGASLENVRSRSLVQLVLELDRHGREAEALPCLRAIEPGLAALATEELRHAVTAADALLPLAACAARAGDAALADRLRSEARRLLAPAKPDVEKSLPLAGRAASVARELGDEDFARWLKGLRGDAGLAPDFDALERKRAAGDPLWEPIFDALEAELEALGPEPRAYAREVYVRSGLPRAAFRHWEAGGRHLDAALLAALRRDRAEAPYLRMVEAVYRHRVEPLPVWNGVGTAVELALARAAAGDPEGARLSARRARGLAGELATVAGDSLQLPSSAEEAGQGWSTRPRPRQDESPGGGSEIRSERGQFLRSADRADTVALAAWPPGRS